ncbi:MAG: hypothetical protein IPI57_07235 [Candidatus Competibacteraceae bacterium]|nr:hypothetical protein [Candidatus Competibacteraceae bacterium]
MQDPSAQIADVVGSGAPEIRIVGLLQQERARQKRFAPSALRPRTRLNARVSLSRLSLSNSIRWAANRLYLVGAAAPRQPPAR